jgi:hypothetical protein
VLDTEGLAPLWLASLPSSAGLNMGLTVEEGTAGSEALLTQYLWVPHLLGLP